MQKRPSTDSQKLPMEYIAGPIEAYCQADGVFGQDSSARRTRILSHCLSVSLFLAMPCQGQVPCQVLK